MGSEGISLSPILLAELGTAKEFGVVLESRVVMELSVVGDSVVVSDFDVVVELLARAFGSKH